MIHGYTGKIARLNLTDRTVAIEKHDDSFYRQYFGGRGVIAYYLLKELSPGIDPLSPANKLIFAAGLLTGYPIPGAARNSVGGKSPLTHAYGEAEVGGFWGTELKRAGWDALIVEGRSPAPVYLWIHDEEIEFRDARHLWGELTGECQRAIRDELGDERIRVAQIGPGGERLVRYACVTNDLHHFAGRTGMGAVMGSKNLKAIAVRGGRQLPMANPAQVQVITKWLGENYRDLCPHFNTLGTGANTEAFSRQGGLPTQNFAMGSFGSAAAISAQAIRDQIRVGMEGCYACPVKCKKVVRLDEPFRVDPVYGGPEYETLAALGSNCGVSDLRAIAKASELCNAYTVDTISAGGVIAFAMECFERGLVGRDETDGVELRFGNTDAMLTMVERICRREGFGRLLGEGVARLAKHVGQGSESFALHVKGLEYPMHEPRYKWGMGLGYGVSPTGADHCHNIHDTSYASEGRALDMLQAMGVLEPLPIADLGPAKVRLFTCQHFWRSLNNSLCMCSFLPYSPEQIVTLVSGVTGWTTSMGELAKVSERSLVLARLFNIREGLGRNEDQLAPRSYEPFTSGPLAGVKMDRERFQDALTMYYEMMGWESEDGIPRTAKLHELDIAWAVEMCPQIHR